MTFVREVDEVGETLKPHPGHRRTSLPMFEQVSCGLAVGSKVLVTSHAELHGWNPGGRGAFGKPMTVEAIDLETPRVELMAEG
jgi:hypothetical protein